jgi:hypothetical protein
MTSNYVIWRWKNVANACVLQRLEGVKKQYQLRDGISRVADFPEEAAFAMNPDFPHDTLLTDNIININQMIVASARLKDFMEARKLPKVEFLPVTILNHRGKPVSQRFFIIHLLDHVDCLEVEKCSPVWSKIDTDTIQRLKRLVIDEKRIGKSREIFRPKHFPEVVLVYRKLAEAIDAAAFEGITWKELDTYPRSVESES